MAHEAEKLDPEYAERSRGGSCEIRRQPVSRPAMAHWVEDELKVALE